MQRQYREIKEAYSDHILLFRLGDFYEVFNEDALALSNVLGITLTARGKGEEKTPMAGIPHHSLPTYLPKIVEANLKIAIADQTEEAVPGKLVKRKVTKVITPGTVIDPDSLDSSKNNYIASLYYSSNKTVTTFFFAYLDLTTGELNSFDTPYKIVLQNELKKVSPAEIIVKESHFDFFSSLTTKRLEKILDQKVDETRLKSVLLNQFGVRNLKGFGIEELTNSILSIGMLIDYVKDNQKVEIKHISRPNRYSYKDYMQLDYETVRNLELIQSLQDGTERTSLYGILNRCQNPMGKRLLRSNILKPIISREILQDRLDTVEFFYKNYLITQKIRDFLKNITDLERVTGRIGLGSINPKDLNAIRQSIYNLQELIQLVNTSGEALPQRLNFLMSNFQTDHLFNLMALIENSIQENAPAITSEGGIFKSGYNSEVDELRNISLNAKNILKEIQQRESSKTKIPSLKISFNKVFGYYIEVTRTHLDKVPEEYIRKQTLVNAERYITQELKELEDKILTSQDKLIELESKLYREFVEMAVEYIGPLLEAAKSIAEIDLLSNFGYLAKQLRFTKPEIVSDELLEIKNGRHPVVESIVNEFVPNNTVFYPNSQIHILTGPNMSGKSTYIRQVALITLMAQIGSFVPADSMKFKIVDRVFTRVGASDNLAKGESTFMVEMTETANILNNATKDSLVILDEVGRGTSTYDGVAIAWSIIEYLETKILSKTLFATHYHELISLEKKENNIKNFNVQVEEKENKIYFKHKIVEGGTNRSYGVHVADLAGVPKEVIDRAEEILEKFENDNGSENYKTTPKKEKRLSDSQIKTNQLKDNDPRKPKKIHPEQLGLM